MARREQNVAEGAVRVELEAPVDGPDALDPGRPEALVPAAARAQLVDVTEELGHGGAVAVADGLAAAGTGSRLRAASRAASPGNEVG